MRLECRGRCPTRYCYDSLGFHWALLTHHAARKTPAAIAVRAHPFAARSISRDQGTPLERKDNPSGGEHHRPQLQHTGVAASLSPHESRALGSWPTSLSTAASTLLKRGHLASRMAFAHHSGPAHPWSSAAHKETFSTSVFKASSRATLESHCCARQALTPRLNSCYYHQDLHWLGLLHPFSRIARRGFAAATTASYLSWPTTRTHKPP